MWLRFLLPVFFFISLALGTWFSWIIVYRQISPKNEINLRSFEKIQSGMTEKEVEKILGGPNGQYFRGKAFVMLPAGTGARKSSGYYSGYRMSDDSLRYTAIRAGKIVYQEKAWIGEEISIWIWFDADGLVWRKTWDSVALENESMFETIQRWLDFSH